LKAILYFCNILYFFQKIVKSLEHALIDYPSRLIKISSRLILG